jgi:hypothetical protein
MQIEKVGDRTPDIHFACPNNFASSAMVAKPKLKQRQ